MSWSAGKSEKKCATCAYWGGTRKLRGSSTVETEHHDLKGKCFKNKAPSTSGSYACHSCSCHELWAPLK